MPYSRGGKTLNTRTKVHKTLSQKSSEYEGNKTNGSKTFWFADSEENFRTNYYGIVGYNGEGFGNYPPNPIAMKYAKDAMFTMNRYNAKNGTNNLSSLMYLYNFLIKMADQLARDEKRYLKKKLQDIKNHSKFRGEYDSLDYILPGGEDAFIKAIDSDNFSEAFTLLMSKADSYDALLEELDAAYKSELYKKGNMSGSAAKTSDFYNGIDINHLLNQTNEGQRFLERLSREFTFTVNKDGNLSLTLSPKSQYSSMDELSQAIIEKAAKAYDVDAEVAAQFEDNKKLTIQSLTKVFNDKIGRTVPRNWLAQLESLGIPREDSKKARAAMEKAIKNKKKLNSALSKKNKKIYPDLKKISLATLLNTVFNSSSLQKGYLGEMSRAADAQGKGLVYLTGTTNTARENIFGDKENIRVMTTDLVMLDGPFQDIMDDTMKDLRKKWIEGNKDTRGAILNETIEYLKERALKENKSIRDIFEVKINIKTYRGSQDLKTVYKDTFGTIGGRLGWFARDLKKQKSKATDPTIKRREEYAWVHRARSFNNLLWMLNNTFEKGFAAQEIQTISNMIAGVAFLWMWEEIGDTFTAFTEEMAQQKGLHTTIYVFNSGTAYFTASQILKQTANYILEMRENANPMVDVEIVPTKGITNEYYESLKKHFPVGSDITDDKAPNTVESNMEVLRQRWIHLRNKSLKEGKMAISFNQHELDKLLGTLSIVNRQS